jgi:hypothetical protein
MIGFAAQRLVELEVDGLNGAGVGEKSLERLPQRNGYRARDWEMRGGSARRSTSGSRPSSIVPFHRVALSLD